MVTRYFSLHIILFVVAGFFSLASFAQQARPATPRVSVSRSRILIGEQTELTMKLELTSGQRFSSWPNIPDILNHFEVLNRGKLDSIRSGENMLYTQSFTITSFDSGHWVIPSFIFQVGKSKLRSDSLVVDVGTVVLKGDEYNDIKDIIPVKEPGFDWKKWLPYIIGTILILALVTYWYMNRKKKPLVVEKPVDRSTAYEHAMNELKKLKSEQLPEKGEMKQYYSRLYDIYRIYLGRYSGVNMLQFTTDDILLKAKDIISSSSFSKMAEVLRISDAVKFAKYGSSVQETNSSWDIINGVIEDLNRQKS